MSDVHASFRTTLEEADWMDSQTKTAGLKKLDEMLQLVGYGKMAMNATAVNKLYEEVCYNIIHTYIKIIDIPNFRNLIYTNCKYILD